MPPRAANADPTAPHRLTAASVAALPVGAERYEVRDTAPGGLRVRVTAAGVKSFAVLYRPKGSPTLRRLTLGTFPMVTPDEARRAALRAKGAAAGGADPAGAVAERRTAERAAKVARDAAPAVVTVADLAARYLAKSRGRLRASTATLYGHLLRVHILPALGARHVAEVTTADVSAFHAAMHDRRTVADGSLRLVSTLLRFAEREGLRPRGSNPAADVPRYATAADGRRERYLDGAELAALLSALDRAERDGLPPAPHRARVRKAGPTAKHRPRVGVETPLPANPVSVAALRLALLTGMRKREVLGLRWDEVDRAAGLLRLDATKTGRSVRPLSAAAGAVLDRVPRVVGSPYVFPAPRDPRRPLATLDRLWDAVRHAAGLAGTRLHDLRHTAASMMLQHGATLAEVGRALGHTSARTTERYAHVTDAGMQRAADLLGAAVARAGDAPAEPVVVRAFARPARRA